MDSASVARDRRLLDALAAISRSIGESLELREVFARVAETTAQIIPFDRVAVLLLEGPDELLVHSAAAGVAWTEGRILKRGDCSPMLWIDPLLAPRVHDAPSELDSAFAEDRAIQNSGVRSILRAPLERGDRVIGALAYGSKEPNAFSAENEIVARAIAELLSAALGHEQLARAERERRRKIEALDSLLPAFASVLDVREAFAQLCSIVRGVLPYDLLSLGLISADDASIRVHASTDPEFAPVQVPIDPMLRTALSRQVTLVEDVEFTPDDPSVILLHGRAAPAWSPEVIRLRLDLIATKLFVENQIRSQVFLPIRWRERLIAFLVVDSRTPSLYTIDDAHLGVRIADHVALTLAHEQLASEKRRAEDERERAHALENRVAALTEELEARSGHRAVGTSASWRAALSQATKVAATETTVLLTGESGTGKEVVARYVHHASPRAQGPFVAINCAALPEQLLESELFGHEKGAFTGAAVARAGRIEQAAGGVLFLDEVGEMSPLVQAKLLRVLQEREFQRLGGTRTLAADVRIVAATNRDLIGAMDRGDFREDLYYRLAVFAIHLPPLRERTEDVLVLVEHFLSDLGPTLGHADPGLTREARNLLMQYNWPGNARELRNVLERALILSEGGLIDAEHLALGSRSARPSNGSAAAAPPVAPSTNGESELPPEGVDLEAVERSYVERALRQSGNNKSRAARLLGLTRAQLYSRLEKFGL